MSLWSRAFDFLTAPQTPDARHAGPLELRADASVFVPFSTPVPTANWRDVSMERVTDTAHKVGVVMACTTLLADAVSEAPIKVYRVTDGEPVEQDQHPLRALMANPNPLMAESEFIGLVVVQQAMQGYAVVEIVRSPAGLPAELYPLRPDWLTKARGDRNWTYRVPTFDPRSIKPDDVLFIPFRHDDRMVSPGISPLLSIGREIGIDYQLCEFLKVYLDAGGIPPYVAVQSNAEQHYSKAEVEIMQDMWQSKFGGSHAYGKMPFLNSGWDIKPLGDGIEAMAWPDLRSITEDKICQAFRVPRELVQTRSTAGGSGLTTTEMFGAMRYLQMHGAQPLRARIDGAFTRGLLPLFTGGDPSYALEFDTDDVLALQEDENTLHERIRADWSAGLLMQNEARAAIGLDPVPGGDVFLSSIAEVQIPGTMGTPPVRALAARNDGEFEDDGFAERTVDRVRRAYAAGSLEYRAAQERRARAAATGRQQILRIATRTEPLIQRFLNGQRDRVLASVPTPRAALNGHAPEVRVAETIDWDAEDDELAKVLRQVWAVAGERAFDVAGAQLAADLVWDVANPHILDILSQVATRVTAVNDATQRDIARVVGQWTQDGGGGIDTLRDALKGLYEESYASRSMTIARTESQVAYGLGSQAAYRESGVIDRVELFDSDTHCDDYGASDGWSCCERNGQIVPLEQADLHVFAEHPNGSLSLAPVVVGDS